MRNVTNQRLTRIHSEVIYPWSERGRAIIFVLLGINPMDAKSRPDDTRYHRDLLKATLSNRVKALAPTEQFLRL